MLVGQIAVEQIGLDPGLSESEDLLGNLPAGLEPAAIQCRPIAGAAHGELELVVVVREHDEPALGAADGDGRIHHEPEDLVDHAGRAQRAQPFEQRGHLPEVADTRRRRFVRRIPVGQQKDDRRAAGAPEPDTIPIGQDARLHLLIVDEGAVAGAAIGDREAVIRLPDLGMVARHLRTRQMERAADTPADRERDLLDRDDPATEDVGHLETGFGHTGGDLS